MTALPEKKRSLFEGIGITPGQFCFGCFALFCLFLILRNADVAISYMKEGLYLCAVTVIPSLFPFMVLSEWIVSADVTEKLLSFVITPFSKFFRISKVGSCAVLLGIFCGFPVGARCVLTALDDGKISREEAERILLFSGNPSSAFLITAVGVSLWGNRTFGVVLYLTVLLCQILTGFFVGRFSPVLPEMPILHGRIEKSKRSGVAFFTKSIQSSALGMLLICAYVVFFSALVGTLGLVLDSFSSSQFPRACVFSFFELSGGMRAAATVRSPFLVGFCAGWSGLSVHCQLLSLCDGHGFRFKKYFFVKLLQGVFCMLFFPLFLKLWGG